MVRRGAKSTTSGHSDEEQSVIKNSRAMIALSVQFICGGSYGRVLCCPLCETLPACLLDGLVCELFDRLIRYRDKEPATFLQLGTSGSAKSSSTFNIWGNRQVEVS
ncbi:MAG: hypothetical protein E8D42_11220 [Nitrospira sp.]|nr:MAG: hypothetical protein E8D42_11220 [Nitrospira sp.]